MNMGTRLRSTMVDMFPHTPHRNCNVIFQIVPLKNDNVKSRYGFLLYNLSLANLPSIEQACSSALD